MSAPLPAADVEPDAGPTDAQIARVRDLAERAASLAADASQAERALAALKEELKAAVERDLPNAMRDARLTTWPMPGGARYDLATTVSASIPKDSYAEALDWLAEHGHADVIKHRFTILFGRDEFKWAAKFLADLRKRKRPLNVERKDWVEPQTLGAFVREQRREAAAQGRDPDELAPTKLLGVFELTYAKFVPPKERA